MNKAHVGLYWPIWHAWGPAIHIAKPQVMKNENGPLFSMLRDTILHETQHAIDDKYGIVNFLHNRWWDKRLQKLTELFPI